MPGVKPGRPLTRKRGGWRVLLLRLIGVLLVLFFAWLAATAYEIKTGGDRILPWSAYQGCGNSKPAALPDHVRVGLYEEFPVPGRLEKLGQLDFPVTLAVAAPSRVEFLQLRDMISQTYPQIREVVFWPVLAQDEGYYPAAWSDGAAVRRVAAEAEGLPVLWDLEMPLNGRSAWPWEAWSTAAFLDEWLRQRSAPVYAFRTFTSLGLNPAELRATGLIYDPASYPAVTMQLDMYAILAARQRPPEETAHILRCGVEQYGERFIPAFGVLNDGEGPDDLFVTPERLRQDLRLARAAGVSEVWLFSANGLNAEYLAIVRDELRP